MSWTGECGLQKHIQPAPYSVQRQNVYNVRQLKGQSGLQKSPHNAIAIRVLAISGRRRRITWCGKLIRSSSSSSGFPATSLGFTIFGETFANMIVF